MLDVLLFGLAPPHDSMAALPPTSPSPTISTNNSYY